jgi:hypothetical protein
MLTRNRAKLLNIEVANNIPLPEKKKKRSQKKSSSPSLSPCIESQSRMVTFVENIEIIEYSPSSIRPLYEVNIDFDEAHEAWVANKIKQKNGCYKYRKHPKKVSKK